MNNDIKERVSTLLFSLANASQTNALQSLRLQFTFSSAGTLAMYYTGLHLVFGRNPKVNGA